MSNAFHSHLGLPLLAFGFTLSEQAEFSGFDEPATD